MESIKSLQRAASAELQSALRRVDSIAAAIARSAQIRHVIYSSPSSSSTNGIGATADQARALVAKFEPPLARVGPLKVAEFVCRPVATSLSCPLSAEPSLVAGHRGTKHREPGFAKR